MDIDEAPPLLVAASLGDRRGWTRGPAPLSQLTVRTVCRETCLAAARPGIFEHEDPLQSLWAKGDPLQLSSLADCEPAKRASLQQLGRLDGQDRTVVSVTCHRLT